MTSPTRSTLSTTIDDRPDVPEPRSLPQYSRRRVLLTWLAAAAPMWVLAWLVAPWLAGILDGPNPMVRALIVSLTAGMVWQFVLVMALVRREQGSLRWSVGTMWSTVAKVRCGIATGSPRSRSITRVNMVAVQGWPSPEP